MKSLLDQLAACNATQMEYNIGFGEVNALLWTVTVGLNENKDVNDEIDRLEKLLGVECRCSACAGEKVGPTCLPACPQVSDDVAMVLSLSQTVTGKSDYRVTGFSQTSDSQWSFQFAGTPSAGDSTILYGNVGLPQFSIQSDALAGWTPLDVCNDLEAKLDAALKAMNVTGYTITVYGQPATPGLTLHSTAGANLLASISIGNGVHTTTTTTNN